ADGKLALYVAHRMAEGVHQTIVHNFPRCTHCIVHVNTTEVHYAT
ncbi:cation transporter dimerization domain-containing protein, partial [Clostridioides difficile]|nr:cation-efflux pump [Clostridioides difficile]